MIYILAASLTSIQQVTFSEMGFEKAGEGYFSPDDSTIIFQAVPAGQKHYQIFTLRLGDIVPKRVSTGCGACTCSYFRPDGKKIIFASSHESPELLENKDIHSNNGKYKWDLTPYMNVYEANPDGTELKALTSGPAYHAECAYSPDGKSIVYASNEDGAMNLYTMDSDGSNVKQVTHNHHCYYGGPFFSPDGKKILFRADRDKPDYLQIYQINLDGTDEQQLTDNGAVNWAPYWHPSGKYIAYTTSIHGHHQYEIYLLHLEENRHIRLTYNPSFDGLPVFSNDGKKMLWTSKRGGQNCHLYLADFIP